MSNPRKSASHIEKYGLGWPTNILPIAIEMKMCREGGTVKTSKGEIVGNGLAFHFKEFQKYLWPEEKIWHKWNQMAMEARLKYTYIAELGCAAAGKSNSAASDFLADWYIWPECTTVLVTSTDYKGLDLRVWGMMKAYHRSAKTRWPWLPGHLIESRYMLVQNPKTEAVDGRDFRNGVVGVATRKGSTYVGLGCFPAGTFVDTPVGKRRIEHIKAGDEIISACGISKVRKCSTRISDQIVRVTTRDGRIVDCTPNHPFFTQDGWIKAVDITAQHYIMSAHEALQILREKTYQTTPQTEVLWHSMSERNVEEKMCGVRHAVHSIRGASNFLFEVLWGEMEMEAAKNSSLIPPRDKRKGQCSDGLEGKSNGHGKSRTTRQNSGENAEKEGGGTVGLCEEKLGHQTRTRRQGFWKSRERLSSINARTEIVTPLSRRNTQFSDSSRHNPQGKGWLALLSSRFGVASDKTCGGTGWGNPYPTETNNSGSEKRFSNEGSWVENVTLLKRDGDVRYLESEGGYRVHNLEVAGHPSYSVNGLLSHNSFVGIHNKRVHILGDEIHLLPRAFVDSASNLSKCPKFLMDGLGNPNETTNALGFLGEPSNELGGWEGGIDQTPGTKSWPTRMPNGIALQYPGSDSPNIFDENGNDVPEPPPYPFLMTRQQMEDDAKIWGRDDWHYAMMNDAKMPRGQGTRRVITRQECERKGATLEPFWRDTHQTKIASLDAAYRGVGGDRCVFTEMWFGKEAESNPMLSEATPDFISQKHNEPAGRNLISMVDQLVIPISGEKDAPAPEDQIVTFCKSQLDARGIPYGNLYYDAGMKTSLVQAFARAGMSSTNTVDFGGKPTENSVSAEIPTRCCDYYQKFVTELWYSVRMAIEAKQFRNLSKECMWELCAREWKHSIGSNRIEVETKAEMKEKSGRSPDLADSLAIAMFGARQRGFQIGKLAPPRMPRSGPDWRDSIRKMGEDRWKQGRLVPV